MVERDYLDNLKKYMRTIEDKIKVIKIDDKKIKALKEILGHFAKLLKFVSEVIKNSANKHIEQLNLNKEELREIIQALEKLEDKTGETGGNKSQLYLSIEKSIRILKEYESGISKNISHEERYIKLAESLLEIANILRMAEQTIEDVETLWDIFEILSKLICALHPVLLHLTTISAEFKNETYREFGKIDKSIEVQLVPEIKHNIMRYR